MSCADFCLVKTVDEQHGFLNLIVLVDQALRSLISLHREEDRIICNVGSRLIVNGDECNFGHFCTSR